MTKFIKKLQGVRRWWMQLFGVQFMNAHVSSTVCETCDRYGEQVIGTMLAGGFIPSTADLQAINNSATGRIDARDWLTEHNSLKEYRERWIPLRDLILEVVVIGLIGWEIWLGYRQDNKQVVNFDAQQKVLKDLAGNTQATAKVLGTLQGTTEKMKDSIVQDLIPQAHRSAVASERSAKASESSSKTAVDALHISERAYVSVQPRVNAPLKAGEKPSFTVQVLNSGKTPAKNVVVKSRSSAAPTDMPLPVARELAFAGVSFSPLSKAVLGSQGTMDQVWNNQDKIDERAISLLKDKKLMLYVFVDVTYDDEFNVGHHTQACAFYHTDIEKMGNCESLNASD